jgi:hypothetical protein
MIFALVGMNNFANFKILYPPQMEEVFFPIKHFYNTTFSMLG